MNSVLDEPTYFGTCHLHGDVHCGKISKPGSDGKMYSGRIQCTSCGTIFCRNGLWKKFGELVEGDVCARWICRLCLGTCCCRSTETCRVTVPNTVSHSHCHNFRSAYGQRRKRRQIKLQNSPYKKVSHDTVTKAFSRLYNSVCLNGIHEIEARVDTQLDLKLISCDTAMVDLARVIVTSFDEKQRQRIGPPTATTSYSASTIGSSGSKFGIKDILSPGA